MKIRALTLATAMLATATGYAVAQTNTQPGTKQDVTAKDHMDKSTMSKDSKENMSKDTMSKDKMAKDKMNKDKGMNGSGSVAASPGSTDAGIKQEK